MDTQVTYPRGDVHGKSRVVTSTPLENGHGVVTEETPFHPLDHTWPDQPADRGTVNGLPVLDCVTGASDGTRLYLGTDIPARRGAEGWDWLVVHVLEEPVDGEAELIVDAAYRRALSAGHTACHLTALALNEALAGRWRKETVPDSLGHPDFDQAAIFSSRVSEYGSTDVYRLGKSLRRKGFDAEGLDLTELTRRIEDRLAEWIAADAPVMVEDPSGALSGRRTWRCSLPEGQAHIPCGGTHVTRTSELGAVGVSLSFDGAELTMRSLVSTPPLR
ncbi:metal-dependent hydrolase [Sphaerisporangium album]|uniref:Metal-dependent hydrolase n=1 Tax=Sphaerisporangium album TaxID=509200 RepID=A0A367FPE0_9ACTN|nr:metal-dependent hydrolase [Sphaerisporangium album]RCG32258.1 metal-dependent hydrolase [Sphaerisporangium album]